MKKIKEIINKLWNKIFSDGYLPKYHKLSMMLAIIFYLIIAFTLISWISSNSKATIKSWYEKIPSVSTIIETKIFSATPDQATDASTKKISIIITDLGLSQSITEKAINDLPKEFVLTFSPYSSNLSEMVSKSIQKEHENLILIPMESAKYPDKDSGPKLLSARLSQKENTEHLDWVFEKGHKTIGIMNFLGSAFLGDKKLVSNLFDILKNKDLFFIENIVTSNTETKSIATEKNIKYFKVDKKIKSDVSKERFMKQLDELENTAENNGYAIGVVEPYPMAIDLVKEWSLKLNRKGFVLASLSTLWKNVSHHD